MNIPIDLTHASPSKSPIKKLSPNQQQEFNLNHHQNYELLMNPKENTTHYNDLNNNNNNQQRPSSSYSKRTVHDVPITNRPSTAHSTDRTVNELRVNLSSPSTFQQQKKVSLQIDEQIPQQRITK